MWRVGAMALDFTTTKVDGVNVILLRGAILFGEEPKSLRLLVKDLLTRSPKIVLDLGEVTRIDSGGVGILVNLHASARKAGYVIKLANLDNHAKEVLQITRLAKVFDIFEQTEEAIASFKVAAAKY